MAAADRALKLNAQAVAKLNDAILTAQRERDEPDVAKIAADVLTGKRVAELGGGWSWSGFFIVLLIIGAIIAGTTNKTIGLIVMSIFFFLWVLPLITGLFSMFAEWTRSITSFSPYGGGPAPKCDASGCSGSASYAFDPTGYGNPMKLCYDHKSNFENRVRYAPFFQPEVAKSIVRAYQELLRAAKLDPYSTVIQQNLEQARELAQIVLERKLAS
jgi:hypothetical protein